MGYLKIKSNISYLFLIVIFAMGMLFALGIFPSLSDIDKPVSKKEISGDKFMGAGSCASSNCHGAAEPRASRKYQRRKNQSKN